VCELKQSMPSLALNIDLKPKNEVACRIKQEESERVRERERERERERAREEERVY